MLTSIVIRRLILPMVWEPDLFGIMNSAKIDEGYVENLSEIMKVINNLLSGYQNESESQIYSQYYIEFLNSNSYLNSNILEIR